MRRHLRVMPPWHRYDAVDFSIGDHWQFLTGRLGQNLHPDGVLQQVQIYKRVCYMLADDADTVMSHEHDLVVAKLAGDAFALAGVKDATVEFPIIDHLAVKLERVL